MDGRGKNANDLSLLLIQKIEAAFTHIVLKAAITDAAFEKIEKMFAHEDCENNEEVAAFFINRINIALDKIVKEEADPSLIAEKSLKLINRYIILSRYENHTDLVKLLTELFRKIRQCISNLNISVYSKEHLVQTSALTVLHSLSDDDFCSTVAAKELWKLSFLNRSSVKQVSKEEVNLAEHDGELGDDMRPKYPGLSQ